VLPRALSEREFGFAVANRNAGLAEELNGFLDRAMADRSLEGILDRWLRGPAPRGD
jgi:ABC-type amino acid transport substrate-binding protein